MMLMWIACAASTAARSSACMSRMRLLLPDGHDRHGSPLRLGDQLDVPGSTVVHERCYEAFDTEGRADAEP